MNGLETIMEKSEDMEFDRETEIRDLVRVVEHSTMGTVKSDEKLANYEVNIQYGLRHKKKLMPALMEYKMVILLGLPLKRLEIVRVLSDITYEFQM